MLFIFTYLVAISR